MPSIYTMVILVGYLGSRAMMATFLGGKLQRSNLVLVLLPPVVMLLGGNCGLSLFGVCLGQLYCS